MNVRFNGNLAVVSFAPAVAAIARDVVGGVVADAPVDWAGNYRIEIAGKSDGAVLAAIGDVAAYHVAKSTRLNQLVALAKSTPLVVGGISYEWFVTIRERGTNVEVVVWGNGVPGFPIERVYRSIDVIPSDEEIVAIATGAITVVQQKKVDQAAQIARLQALVGGV